MIPVTTLKDRRVAVFGLGGSGRVSVDALLAGGAEVVAFDDRAETVERATADGVPTGDLRDEDWSSFAALVLAPGVPLTHPEPHWSVLRAEAAGVPVIGDIELFARERRAHHPEAPFVAITGTNGKSTTTALIAHMLEAVGRSVGLGGNIGTAVLSLPGLSGGRTYVVECSSYQIDLAPSLNPSVGVLLNLAPDHLDRHGTMENYAAVKRRLVAGSDVAVIGVDDRMSSDIADALSQAGRRVVRISNRFPLAEGVYAAGTRILEADNATQTEIADIAGISSLRGAHNAQNAAAAVAVCRALGVPAEKLQGALASFPGLKHRMEPVARIGRVHFINDSKATNADAAARALASFERIYWIAGGRPKSDGIAALSDYFPKIVRAYLIGEAAEGFADTLGAAVDHVDAGTLEAAVAMAAEDAERDGAGEIAVLLSPACASFDQYANFEKRGDAFRAAVAAYLESRGKLTEKGVA